MTETTEKSEKNNKEHTSITMDPALLATVRKSAQESNQSVSQFISSAVKKYLE